MRRAAKSDANRSNLVALARKLGCLVYDIREPVDLLVGIGPVWYGVEIKGPQGRYTAQQKAFFKAADAKSLPVLTWRTEQDVLDALK